MNCPKCGYIKVKYIEQRNVEIHKKETKNDKNRRRQQNTKNIKSPPRTNFQAKCIKCGWIGKL